jgi:hypothetical protein
MCWPGVGRGEGAGGWKPREREDRREGAGGRDLDRVRNFRGRERRKERERKERESREKRMEDSSGTFVKDTATRRAVTGT